MRIRSTWPGALAAVALLLAGCSSGGDTADAAAPSAARSAAGAASGGGASQGAASQGAAAPGSAGLPRPAHVVIAVFENKGADVLAGAPYLSGLAAKGAAFSDAHGETHPSQPNYLALFSGSTQGVTDDSCPQSFSSGNLAAQLQDAGLSFTGYSEGLPGPGYTGCRSGRYARRHNPWVNWPALPASVNQPLSAMPADLAKLPTVAVVVPDVCSDMHNCPVGTGDDWARQHLGPYADWAAANDSLLVVTFDEDDGTRANHIPTFVVGAGVHAGTYTQRIDHYSLLRTVEDMYGLKPLGSAASASALTGIWR